MSDFDPQAGGSNYSIGNCITNLPFKFIHIFATHSKSEIENPKFEINICQK